jgi:hypothetical protein
MAHLRILHGEVKMYSAFSASSIHFGYPGMAKNMHEVE